MKIRALVLACAGLFAAPLHAQTPSDAIRDFYTAYGNDDSQRTMSLLTANFDPVLRSQIRSAPILRCIEVRSLHLRTVAQDDAKATIEVAVRLFRRGRTGRWSGDEVERRTFTVVKIEGAWRIQSMPLAEEALIDALVKTQSREEVDALLAAHPDLLTPALVRQLTVRAITLGRAGAGRPIPRIADIARDVALIIGDRNSLSRALATQVTARMNLPDVDARTLVPIGEEALRAAREADDIGSITYAANNLALVHLTIDAASVEAESVWREDLALRDRLPPLDVAVMLSNLAEILLARGDYAGAYRDLSTALAFFAANGPEQEAAAIEFKLGDLLLAQNDPELALEYFRRGSQRKAPPLFLAGGYLGIARASRALGRGSEARAAAEKALELARTTPFKDLIAQALVMRAELESDRGDVAAAETTLAEAIAAAREKEGEIDSLMEALLVLGDLHFRRGRFAEARRAGEEVLDLSARSDFPRPERYVALMLIANVERALGNRARALEAYCSVVEVIEAARGAVAGNEREQRLFFEPRHGAYAEAAALLIESGRVEEALVYAERGKARVLRDTMGRQRKQAENALGDADRKALAARVAALGEANRQVIALRASETSAAALAAEVARQRAAQLALETFESDLAGRHPALRAAGGGAAAIDAAALREVVSRPDMVVVEFVVREKATHLLVVERRGDAVAVTQHPIDVDAAALAARVDAFHAGLAGGSVRYRAPARALYDLLLAPARRELAGKRVVCVVPDGVLWRLPFEALLAPDGRFAVERRSFFYAPSIGVYRDVVGRRKQRGAPPAHMLAAFGNPAVEGARARVQPVYRSIDLAPLPDAEREAKQIARLWGARSSVYTGRAAREEAAKREMQRARIVHFAAHGIFDDNNPMFSHIVLAQGERSPEDGALQAWEVMRLNLAADLVVLSACDTARGRFGAGEGLIGMSWALFAAGCPSTVATQWKVSSPDTAALMIAFHRRLSRGARTPFAKAEALRAAQREMLRDPARRHPFYWAAFVLLGDPS